MNERRVHLSQVSQKNCYWWNLELHMLHCLLQARQIKMIRIPHCRCSCCWDDSLHRWDNLYTLVCHIWDDSLQKKKEEKRKPSKQKLYFHSTTYNLTLFDCVAIMVLSQKCSRMKSAWIWIHSGVISEAHWARPQLNPAWTRPQLNPRLDWSQRHEHHILNDFLIAIPQQSTFANTF